MNEAIVGLLAAILALVGAGVRSYIKTTLTPRRMAAIVEWTRNAVTAAEKLGLDVDLELDGPGKYRVAEQSVEVFAKRVGLKLSPAETNTLIHAVLVELDGLQSLFARGLPLPEVDDFDDDGYYDEDAA